MERTEIKALLPEELAAEFKAMGLPAFRAKQVFRWIHRQAASFAEMTDLPLALRETLEQKYRFTSPKVLRKQVSSDGTVKYLWELWDGNSVESVVMRYAHGNTVCISSQVGCRQGCAFCASTIGGKIRDLSSGELLDQVLFSQKDSGVKINNIVLMGIGEPLDNFENVTKFLQLVNHPDGIRIGMRHISLSTCGIVEKIDKLRELDLQLTLSVSLHAPDDETRQKIMPINRKYNVDELLAACDRYFASTGRRISFEYAMIDGVNDTPKHAELLGRRLAHTGSHVNLIPLNEVEESPLKPSKPDNLKRFVGILIEHGVNVTIRRKLGGDIDASCGQLRRKRERQTGVTG